MVQLLQQTAMAGIYLAGPALAFALGAGVLITVAEAATGIQDSTLTFVPKILAVVGSFFLFGSAQLSYLVSYTHFIFSLLPLAAR